MATQDLRYAWARPACGHGRVGAGLPVEDNAIMSKATVVPEAGIANWTGHGTTRRVDSLPEFFDVLMVGRPTNSPRWLELTEPGEPLASRHSPSAVLLIDRAITNPRRPGEACLQSHADGRLHQ
jgi:hypothetical protein